MRRTTVIFDLDGTLLDTLGDLCDSVNAAMEHFGYPKRSIDEVRSFVGNGARRLIERSLPAGTDAEEVGRVLAWYDEWYTAHSLIRTAPYAGIPELLRELSSREIKLAVVSNKQDAAVKKLVRRFFGLWVSVAIGNSPKIRTKPAPDAVEKAMRELMSEPWECVYVGDSDVDVKTAAAAGIPCVSVSWGFRSRDFLTENGARRIIDAPSQLLDIIK